MTRHCPSPAWWEPSQIPTSLQILDVLTGDDWCSTCKVDLLDAMLADARRGIMCMIAEHDGFSLRIAESQQRELALMVELRNLKAQTPT